MSRKIINLEKIFDADLNEHVICICSSNDNSVLKRYETVQEASDKFEELKDCLGRKMFEL